MGVVQHVIWPVRRAPRLSDRHIDILSGLAAIVAVIVSTLAGVTQQSAMEKDDAIDPRAAALARPIDGTDFKDREKVASFYLAQPWYYRSDSHIKRNDGTDLTLRNMGWDGDMLMPPIDGGVRYIDWYGPAGFMVDFLHNKAVARLGKGAHGRKISNPVIETVETRGTLKGQPAPPQLKLTDLFERFEFTHGQNMLLFGGALRFAGLSPRIRPYVAVGAGFDVPHVEVWFTGEKLENRTNEYQYVGWAASAMAGVELRFGRMSYYLEYKFSHASLDGLLTGNESWKNFNLPGDLLRQFLAWWRGEKPAYGTFSTTLTAHQAVGGIGFRIAPGATAAGTPPPAAP